MHNYFCDTAEPDADKNNHCTSCWDTCPLLFSHCFPSHSGLCITLSDLIQCVWRRNGLGVKTIVCETTVQWKHLLRYPNRPSSALTTLWDKVKSEWPLQGFNSERCRISSSYSTRSFAFSNFFGQALKQSLDPIFQWFEALSLNTLP